MKCLNKDFQNLYTRYAMSRKVTNLLCTFFVVVHTLNSTTSFHIRKMATIGVGCGDFLEFQDALKKMRQLDDKIIYMLNTILPTESFKGQADSTERCKDLYEQIQTGHKTRELAITRCLNASKEKVKQLKFERDNGNDSPKLLKALRKEQNTVRLLQAELNVEEVVKDHTIDVYYKKCRSFYKPPNIEI